MLRRCSLNRNVGIALTAMRALRLGLMGLKVGVDVRVDAASVRSPAAYYPKDAGQDQRCDPMVRPEIDGYSSDHTVPRLRHRGFD